MREILFRGKHVDNGEWVEGSLVHQTLYYGDPVDRYHIIYDGEFDCDYYNNKIVVPETVGQYTGLTDDKNGTKIFEGDIVEFERHGYLPFVEQGAVVFKNGCYGIEYEYFSQMFHRIGEVEEWQDMGGIGTITYTYEVIGNIHDNPELLKGGASYARQTD